MVFNTILLFWLTSSLTCLLAQDFTKDLTQWHEAVKNSETFSVKMQIDIYSGSKQQKLIQQRRASILKKDNKFKVKYDESEMVYSDSLSLMIHHPSKAMTLSSYHPDSISVGNAITGMDTLLSKTDSVIFQEKKGTLTSYAVYTSGKYIQRSILTFNTASHMLEKVNYFYNQSIMKQDLMVEIKFNKLKVNPDISESTFNLDQYIKVVNGVLKPAPNYRNYQLHFNTDHYEK